MNDEIPEYASRLQKLQAESGRTQAENARRAGLQRDAYGRYLHGKTRPPAGKLAALARAFDVSPAAIDPEQPDVSILDADLPPPFELRVSDRAPGHAHVLVDAHLPVSVAQAIAEMVAAHAPRQHEWST